jgi:dihydrofolate reductase
MDGFIARPDGNIDWLNNFPNPENLDFGYSEFIQSVDTTLMGNTTYQLVMSFDMPFPYPDKKNYVFTRWKKHADTEFVQFVSEDPAAFVRKLQGQPGGDIWLIGGGKLNGALLEHDLIDELHLHMIPVVLGEGIPLFDGLRSVEKQFIPVGTHSYYNGILELRYQRNTKAI